MTTLRIERSPEQLAEELRGLEHVDWPAVWAGPPNPGQALDDWCALFGWRPLAGERILSVHSATGQRIALYPVDGGGWAPVQNLNWTTWHLRADSAAENDLVLTQAAEAWTAFEAATRGVLGDPMFSGSWDDPGFPEPPHEHHWLAPREIRHEDMDPYRMAVWPAAGAEGRITVLTVNLGLTPLPGEPRGVLINVDCYPPEAL